MGEKGKDIAEETEEFQMTTEQQEYRATIVALLAYHRERVAHFEKLLEKLDKNEFPWACTDEKDGDMTQDIERNARDRK